ncbi:chemotaxis protein CheW [Geitlerinema sp. PCC 9228]|jgi:chemotaxis signal transduction protein|uniref:chemotaxis protein CheW n=1 Tax=Geitlerinema sp. PCC 9228 TaxID=111611 RepID=UPI0008F9C502|nr:chemotaxis protein CheW [Geitlerinema sp. PCC 9228]
MESPEPIANLNSLDLLFESAPPPPGEKFLRFSLAGEDTVLIPVADIAGVSEVSASDILPVPDLPPFVLGVCSWRGEMLWVVDLADWLGRSPLQWEDAVQTSALAIFIESQSQQLGLVVRDVYDIEYHDRAQIQSPPPGLFPEAAMPYLQGYMAAQASMVLSASALVNSSRLQGVAE